MSDFSLEYLYRQSTLIDVQHLSVPITIVGCGGIGSHTILCLARMGFWNLFIYDHDDVDKFNLNNQGFNIADIGRGKAECMAEKVKAAIGFDIKWKKEFFTEMSPVTDIVIAAVDSMSSRKAIMKTCDGVAALMVDPRMASEYLKIRVFEPQIPDSVKSFHDNYYTDEEAVPEPCTAKSTIYTGSLAGGMIAKIVKDYATGNTYTQSVDWNIAKNSIMSFDKDGNEL